MVALRVGLASKLSICGWHRAARRASDLGLDRRPAGIWWSLNGRRPRSWRV